MSAARDLVGMATALMCLVLLAGAAFGVRLPGVEFLGQDVPAWEFGLLFIVFGMAAVILWPPER